MFLSTLSYVIKCVFLEIYDKKLDILNKILF